mgnify:CR=1 FL=1
MMYGQRGKLVRALASKDKFGVIFSLFDLDLRLWTWEMYVRREEGVQSLANKEK